MYFSIWNIIVILGIAIVLFLFTFSFILLPTLFVTIYEFKKTKSIFYNITGFIRIKTTSIYFMVLAQMVLIVTCTLDLALQYINTIAIVGDIIHGIIIIWVIFQLIVLWSHVISLAENSNLDKNTLPLLKK